MLTWLLFIPIIVIFGIDLYIKVCKSTICTILNHHIHNPQKFAVQGKKNSFVLLFFDKVTNWMKITHAVVQQNKMTIVQYQTSYQESVRDSRKTLHKPSDKVSKTILSTLKTIKKV